MLRNKGIAEESKKTKKIRARLQKRLKEMDRGITPQALKRKLSEIHRWISLYASERIVFRTKLFSFFDENQNTAGLSQKVSAVIKQLKKKNDVDDK